MGCGMHSLELVQADPGVDLGGLDVGMAQELLDETQVGAAFEHQGGGGPFSKRHETIFVAFAASNGDDAAVEFDVGEVQPALHSHPQDAKICTLKGGNLDTEARS